ncbi:iron uptake porin [Synechococcus sp. MU1611]|uniref:iron uptake porin n=1 Tax=Synechococcus sp. MU1611 TaxID=2508345 RepID=UPI001CF8B678|nr:iron uptake porin [Synechococcus sp. MU1611]MCB4411129.1 iron uptake porin [Synechococcus sp. MU1611]
MKLFQQLLVAPAALGLLASGANAAELNINGVSDYAASADQVTSVTQFSDVYPTDWAYQALANLVEQYGCVAGYPNGTFRGNRAMTRYEAAALLNACLDRITEVTDELRRLLKEFETELAILKGRVDGLEARVGELEATQFSTTTKLKGKADWVFGAAKFHGDGSDAAAALEGGTSFSYNLALNLETSFTGKDLLYTRLRAGNMSNVYGGNGIFAQEYGFNSDNAVVVNRMYYSFPIGDDFTVVGGPMVRMDDMLPVWPSAYPSAMTYDFFTYAGAPGAYNLALGAGAGVYWKSDDFSISTSYLSINGNDSNPNTGGIGTNGAGFSATTQLAYAPENWGIAAAYTKASSENGVGLYQGNANYEAAAISYVGGQSNSVGLSAWWTPEDSGWIPSISAGYGGTWLEANNGTDAYTNSWYVGLEWDDVFLEGNSFGMAVGQPTYIVSVDDDDYTEGAGYAWEFFYKFQVTDNITVTPAITYLSKPFPSQDSSGLNAMSGLIKTQFKF